MSSAWWHSRTVQHQRERFVELPDGTQLWVKTSGEGPHVVCCHGGPGLWDYLGDLAALLDDLHLVVRFDPRPWTATDGLLNALPRARRIVLDQAGHAPWRERPDEVQAATLEALTPR